jgi:hypothetical protein
MAAVEIEAAEAAGSNENAKMSEKREGSKRPLPFFNQNSAGCSWEFSKLNPAATSKIFPNKKPLPG